MQTHIFLLLIFSTLKFHLKFSFQLYVFSNLKSPIGCVNLYYKISRKLVITFDLAPLPIEAQPFVDGYWTTGIPCSTILFQTLCKTLVEFLNLRLKYSIKVHPLNLFN